MGWGLRLAFLLPHSDQSPDLEGTRGVKSRDAVRGGGVHPSRVPGQGWPLTPVRALCSSPGFQEAGPCVLVPSMAITPLGCSRFPIPPGTLLPVWGPRQTVSSARAVLMATWASVCGFSIDLSSQDGVRPPGAWGPLAGAPTLPMGDGFFWKATDDTHQKA